MVESSVLIGGKEGVCTDWVNGHGRDGSEVVTRSGLGIEGRVRSLQGRERFEMLGVDTLVEVIVLPGRIARLSAIDEIFGPGFTDSLVRAASTRLVMAEFAGPGQADGHGNVVNIWRTTISGL